MARQPDSVVLRAIRGSDNISSGLFFHIISRLSRTSNQEFSQEDSVLELFRALGYAAFARCCSINRSANSTALAVWIPKKMYRISVSVSFFLALILLIE